jgi:hypothetical protein
MNRRTFLKGLVATTAGVLIPQQVEAEPELPYSPWGTVSINGVRHNIEDLYKEPEAEEAQHGDWFQDPSSLHVWVYSRTEWERIADCDIADMGFTLDYPSAGFLSVNLPPGGKYHTKVYFLGRNVEPERRIWALDSTMVQRGPSGIWIDKTFFEAPFDDLEYRLSLHSNKLTVGDYQADYNTVVLDNTAGWNTGDFARIDQEWMLVTEVNADHLRVIRDVLVDNPTTRQVLDTHNDKSL